MIFKRPKIHIDVVEVPRKKISHVWKMFSRHHYLNSELNVASFCYLALFDDVPVGFNSVMPLPSGTIKNAWRDHRLVVLPDFQGMRIGISLNEFVAQKYIDMNKRFYSKTANIKLGKYRNESAHWRATSQNEKLVSENKNYSKFFNMPENLANRMCYSHEYIGGITHDHFTYQEKKNLSDLF